MDGWMDEEGRDRKAGSMGDWLMRHGGRLSHQVRNRKKKPVT